MIDLKILFSKTLNDETKEKLGSNITNTVPNFMAAIDEYMVRYNEEIKKVEKYQSYENVILVGTGGNAIYLEPLQRSFTKKTMIVDAPHPDVIKKIKEDFDVEKTLVVYMSRSGDTLEVISTYFLLKEYKSLFLASKGILKKIGEKENIDVIDIRTDIAGRFMLATNVVGIPAYLCGLDFNLVLSFAQEQKERLLPDDKENDALNIAMFLYDAYLQGKDKIWFGAYSPELETITYLFNQLINEGAGKENKGPISFIRSVPRGQHELLQRIMGGKNDITSVIFTRKYSETNKIEVDEKFFDIDKLCEDLNGVSSGDIINAEAQGTMEGLSMKNRDFINIDVNDTNLETISKLFILLQSIAYYFCLLEEVDPFSNPDVDLGKEKARNIIKELN